MLIGFNNDVEYQGQMYHIQTEDHGVKDGHITTILFFTGQILDSKKIGYAEDIVDVTDDEERKKIIKKRMVNLHREFYKKLFEGQYEESVKRLLSTKGEASKDVELPSKTEAVPESSKAAKAEPAKAEPAKAEPAKAEPAKAEPAKAEPAKAEPPKLAPRPEPPLLQARPEAARPIGLSRSDVSVASESVKIPAKAELGVVLDGDSRSASLRKAPRSGVFHRAASASQSGASGSWDASGFRGTSSVASKSAFRGLMWPEDELRFDILVARYLDANPSSEP